MTIDKEYGILKNPDGSIAAKYAERLIGERDRYKAALEKIADLDCHYPDGDFMGEDMCAKIALGRNCPQCGANTVPCAFHDSSEGGKTL